MAGALCDRVLVVGWDGFRPDLISAELTPNLHALIERGVRYARSTAVFPSETRPNNATIGTGCLPGRHGITANYMRVPEAFPRELLNTGSHHHLMALATLPNGPRRIVAPRTLGEILTEANRRVAVMGSGSPGQTLLQNPSPFAGWTINRAFAVPAPLEGMLRERFGTMPEPARGEGGRAVDDYLERVAFEYVVPELDPHLLVLWSCEPDSSLHYWGLGSRQVLNAIRANDARLGRMLDRLRAANSLDGTAILFLSDHGHTTVRGRIDLETELLRAGIRTLRRVDDVQVVADGVQLGGEAMERLPRLCGWLREQPWCGPIFVRDDRWDASLVGTAPASVLWDGAPGRWVPDVQLSCAWDDEPNERGLPGHTWAIGKPAARPLTMHGSLSPRDMANTMALAGASIRSGSLPQAPASTADVAPTVLQLLGLPRDPGMQGRALIEAFEDGTADPVTTSETLLEGPWGRLTRHRVGDAAYVSVE